jgi:2,3,4,5-tetrahydropyridine-2,6-dicarboxylate N-succinyltransferase
MSLKEQIEKLFTTDPRTIGRNEALRTIDALKVGLNDGSIRAAESVNGEWVVNAWVKQGILLAFRIGEVKSISRENGFQFFDKDTMAVQQLVAEDEVRIVPGGSAIRDGAFIGKGVVMMPPSYVNIGAYVDEKTMVDSHVLIGSCAQVGKRVHLSAGAQIGGVLEPVGSMPVIIEDDVLVGGNCGIYEGAIIRQRAVLASGVILTGSTPVFDIVREKIYRRTPAAPLVIPAGAVVVPGSRKISEPFAVQHGLSLYAPVIVKYRDEKTDAATALEESLR